MPTAVLRWLALSLLALLMLAVLIFVATEILPGDALNVAVLPRAEHLAARARLGDVDP